MDSDWVDIGQTITGRWNQSSVAYVRIDSVVEHDQLATAALIDPSFPTSLGCPSPPRMLLDIGISMQLEGPMISKLRCGMVYVVYGAQAPVQIGAKKALFAFKSLCPRAVQGSAGFLAQDWRGRPRREVDRALCQWRNFSLEAWEGGRKLSGKSLSSRLSSLLMLMSMLHSGLLPNKVVFTWAGMACRTSCSSSVMKFLSCAGMSGTGRGFSSSWMSIARF